MPVSSVPQNTRAKSVSEEDLIRTHQRLAAAGKTGQEIATACNMNYDSYKSRISTLRRKYAPMGLHILPTSDGGGRRKTTDADRAANFHKMMSELGLEEQTIAEDALSIEEIQAMESAEGDDSSDSAEDSDE